MEEILPGIVTSVVGKLFTGGPSDAVTAILLLCVGILWFLLNRSNKERLAAIERLDELQRYAMDRMNQSNKEMSDLLLTLSDKHATSQEKVATALASVNESVKAVVFDLETRLRYEGRGQ